jgi:hypothetical protein
MAEIKSTLDLVLEKTKNLKMTEEEREKQKEKELRGKIKGTLQQLLDGSLSFEMVFEAIEKESQRDQAVKSILASEALERIDPEGNREGNHKILSLLEKLSPSKRDVVRKLIKDWESTIQVEREKYSSAIKARWAKSGLTGPALIPNLDKDSAWQAHREKKRAAFKEAIRDLSTAH